ncbi:MAG: maleylacetoacetate isomerase [Betaproteobacteria bacterium]|nr:maleylacetoacetate isomerase [Betaproteobacteria bacterium]
MKLYGYWRSLATFRVRIALNLKGIAHEEAIVDLQKGEQLQAAYRSVNPQGVLPSLFDDDGAADGAPLFQSLAILEYLDETHPQPPLLPKAARDRSRVRALALIAAADTHPLVVPRIRNYLEQELGVAEPARMAWCRHWIAQGCAALEANLAADPRTGRFCHGDSVTLADVCLAGHMVGAKLFDVNTSAYPTCERIRDACLALDAFAKAHPLAQPGAPRPAG